MSQSAKRSLGQNFLVDETVVNRIVGSLDLSPDDLVIEIGPGLGALTSPLIERAGRVIAIEFDRDLVGRLQHQFADFNTFELFNLDALSVDFSSLINGQTAKLVANLPYNISTPILQRLMGQRHLFSELVLMFQREVVARITAPPGGKERGFLSVLVENAFDTERLFDVPPEAFRPRPKVWSSVVRLTPKASTIFNEPLFRRIASMSFASKRKTLLNNLKPSLPEAKDILERAEIDPNRRAETLSLAEWRNLTKVFPASG